VLTGRKNKGAMAYRELAEGLLKHWKSGKALPTYPSERQLISPARRRCRRAVRAPSCPPLREPPAPA
jgi:hypothetical protein